MENSLQLQWPFWFVVCAYAALLTGISVYVGRMIKNTDDFYRGGGNNTWWARGLSFFMTTTSASVFVANASFAYNYGLLNTFLIIAQLPVFILGYFVFARLWHRTGCGSAIEFIDHRYGTPTTRFFLWTGIPIRLLENALRVYVTAVLLEALFGIPIFTGVIITAGLALIFTLVGGFLGVVITDALQAILLAVIVGVVAILAWSQIGSLDNFMSSLPEDYWTLRPTDGVMDLPMIIGWIFVAAFAWNANWSLVQRFVSVPTERDAAKVSLMGGVAYYLIFPVLAVPPMLAAALLPELRGTPEVEHSYFLIAWEVLPQGLLGMLCFGIFGATITALNSELNVMSQVIIKDGIRRWVSGLSEKAELFIGRIIIVILLILCVVVSIRIREFGGAFNFLVTLLGLSTLPIFMPILLGLVMRKADGRVCMLSFTGGLATAILLRFVLETPMSVVIFGNGTVTFLLYWLLPRMLRARAGTQSRREALFTRLDTEGVSNRVTADSHMVNDKLLKVTALSLLAVGLILTIASLNVGEEGLFATSGLIVAALFSLCGVVIYRISALKKK